MKRVALASVFLSLGAYAACSSPEPTTGNTGGTGPAYGGASGTTGQGGAAGTAGTPVQGGASGTTGVGGTTAGTAGTPAVGGTSPVGGSGGDGTVTGGSGGDTGVTGGSGGDMSMGGVAGMGMGPGGVAGMGMGPGGVAGMGMGGVAGMGMGGVAGMGMGGAGAGGKGGTGGSAGGTCTATIDGVFNTDRRFDGRLGETPCAVSNSNDCTGGGWRINGGALTGCANNRLDANQTVMIGGTPGQNYTATIHIYGIVEPKAYGGNVHRQFNNTRPTNSPDTTCTGTGDARICGANPPPFAYRVGTGATACQQPACYDGSDYNSYEIHVRDQNGQEKCSYFVNSDTTQGHWTYSLDYVRKINVIGGGSIRLRSFDQNCRQIKNCADNNSATDCTPYARTVNVSAAMPAPANLQQPGLGVNTANSGQWWLLDVTAVECATAAPPADCSPIP